MTPAPGGMGLGGPPKSDPWEAGIGPGNFPLKVVREGQTILLVTTIDRKSLDGARFAPPEGYTKMDLDAMLKRPERNPDRRWLPRGRSRRPCGGRPLPLSLQA